MHFVKMQGVPQIRVAVCLRRIRLEPGCPQIAMFPIFYIIFERGISRNAIQEK